MSRTDETTLDDRPCASGGTIRRDTNIGADVSLGTIFNRMIDSAREKSLISQTDRTSTGLQEQNFIHGLIDAAASTFHVLSFYQGRIFDEGFIGTARDERSIFEIAKLLGEHRRPALSAEAYCSLTAVKIPGDGQPMDVPALMPVQSVPIKGGMPQVFETTHAVRVHPDWNEFDIVPERDNAGPRLLGRSISLILRGSFPGVGTRVPILIRGTVNNEPRVWLRTVDRIARLTKRNLTVLAWKEPIDAEFPDVLIDKIQVESFGAKQSLFGAQAEDWDTMSLDKKVLYSEPIGGLLVQPAPNSDWERVNCPGQVTAIQRTTDGVLLAGIQGAGIHRWSQQTGWIQCRGPFRTSDILCIGNDATGNLLMGTRDRGAFRSPDGGHTWNPLQGESSIVGAWPKVTRVDTRLPPTPVRCILSCTDASGVRPSVLVGTDAGVFSFDQIAGQWHALNEGLPGWEPEGKAALTSVRSIVVNPGTGAVFCGTDQGLFLRPRLDKPWISINVGEAGAGIKSLAINDSGILYAGLDNGGLLVSEDGSNWVAVSGGNSPLTNAKVSQIVAIGDSSAGVEWLFAASDIGLYRSLDRGNSWTEVTKNEPIQSVYQVFVGSNGALWAAGPIVGVMDDEWPGFDLDPTQAVLSGNIEETSLGSTALLEETVGSETRWCVLKPTTSAVSKVTDFGLSERCTTVTWDAPMDDAEPFGRRTTSVRLNARTLRLYPTQFSNFGPISDPDAPLEPLLIEPQVFESMLAISMLVDDLPKSALFTNELLPSFDDRHIGVVGKRPRLLCTEPLQLELDDDSPIQLEANVPMEVTDWPHVSENGTTTWTVIDGLGCAGTVSPPNGTWRLVPAAADQDDITRIRRVRATLRRHHGTHLELDAPIDTPLDLSSVKVMGNIAHVRHGMRVEEVLGSGDETLYHQTFCLRQAPLSWTQEGDDLVPDISVTVSGAEWKFCASLDASGPDDPVYTVNVDFEGNTWILFGDGTHGARLPSGSDNIHARFRVGAGAAGNLEQGHIRLLQQRPPMVRQVLNLTPSSGGHDPESAESFRQRLPASLRAAHRIVSLSDMEQHTCQAMGVSKALVTTVWDGTQPATCLTVLVDGQQSSGAGGEAILERLRDDLAQAEVGASGMHLLTAEVHEFRLTLGILGAPDADPSTLTETVREQILQSFGPAHRDLVQPVTRSEIVSMVMDISGVRDVQVQALSRTDENAQTIASVIRAKEARWNAVMGHIEAAEILVVNPRQFQINIRTQDADS